MHYDSILVMQKRANKVIPLSLLEKSAHSAIIYSLADMGYGVSSISKIMNIGQSKVSRIVSRK